MYNIYEYGIVQGDPKQTVIFEINLGYAKLINSRPNH